MVVLSLKMFVMKYRKLIAQCLAYRSNNNAQVAVAVIAGLAAGAVISVLFAPAQGTDTRRLISKKAKDLGNTVKDSYASIMDKMNGATQMAETEAPLFVRKATKRNNPAVKNHIQETGKGEHTEQSIS